MNSWPRRLRLADITRSHDGDRIALSRRQCGAQPGEYPCYGPEGITARISSFVYEGEYLLVAAVPQVPRAVLVKGRFSAGPRVHVLSCDPAVDPAFLCGLLNADPLSGARSAGLKELGALEFSIPSLEVQRLILQALSNIEAETALLRDQDRVLHGMIRSLFDRFFIFGPGSRPLGEFAVYRPADSPSAVPGESPRESVFYNLSLCPREDLHPFFITALIQNRDFLSYAEGCAEGGIGRRRLDGERLMAFELSGPPGGRRTFSGAYREFNSFAEAAEKKLAANRGELQVLQKLRQNLLQA